MTKFTLIFFKIISLIALFASCSVFNPTKIVGACVVKRGSFDIGSGSTKVLVAKVDVCKKKIIEKIYEKSYPLKFKESLQSKALILDEIDLASLVSTIKPILTTYRKEQGIPFQAVATEVFRQAKNGQHFLEKAIQKLSLDIVLIDQKKEAHLGFWGAVAKSELDTKDIIVWDIGGGSMQLSLFRKGHLFTYLGKLASVSFKDEILKFKGLRRGSPNPIGVFDGLKASSLARKEAERIPPLFREETTRRKVIGIGGVHFYSIKNQLEIQEDTPYSVYQLEEEIKKRSSFKDSQLTGEYRETEVSNLILVKAFMEGLGVETVLPIKVNLTTGVIFNEEMW